MDAVSSMGIPCLQYYLSRASVMSIGDSLSINVGDNRYVLWIDWSIKKCLRNFLRDFYSDKRKGRGSGMHLVGPDDEPGSKAIELARASVLQYTDSRGHVVRGSTILRRYVDKFSANQFHSPRCVRRGGGGGGTEREPPPASAFCMCWLVSDRELKKVHQPTYRLCTHRTWLRYVNKGWKNCFRHLSTILSSGYGRTKGY